MGINPVNKSRGYWNDLAIRVNVLTLNIRNRFSSNLSLPLRSSNEKNSTSLSTNSCDVKAS